MFVQQTRRRSGERISAETRTSLKTHLHLIAIKFRSVGISRWRRISRNGQRPIEMSVCRRVYLDCPRTDRTPFCTASNIDRRSDLWFSNTTRHIVATENHDDTVRVRASSPTPRQYLRTHICCAAFARATVSTVCYY